MATIIDKIFDILAEEIGVERDELVGDCEFADLGVDNLLAKSIISRIEKLVEFTLVATIFDNYPTAADLQSHLYQTLKLPGLGSPNSVPPHPVSARPGPLSFVLQGKPQACLKTLFLLPDGSGSGMAYARLPQIDPEICLIALNSPYLRAPTTTNFTVDGIAALWATEIQSRQPHGPYFLGGWSAGGYYSFEVTKYLQRKGEKVEKLVLIDSPCRLVYEALPIEVVHFLSARNLMGNWGSKSPPAWMVDHFDISIRAIENYMPTPLQGVHMPDVCIIWAEEGVLKRGDGRSTGLDMNVKITQMLVERPQNKGALGWDRLFSGATVKVARMPGNHFTIVYPPNCVSLSALLRDSMHDRNGEIRGLWERV
ncbi:polyketide synthase [Massariosphaeria phaeospora]|uniref:Polyketide synthase n=1 Tax=Massariosphaeria phaeospora TaxID=100035 RepID=A0A7C8ML39_9PLEO|nr:polyketide synthase [Massariosphaeria phaeospora]